jgi:hypothetical protein
MARAISHPSIGWPAEAPTTPNQTEATLSSLLDESVLDMLKSSGVSGAQRITGSAMAVQHACLASFIGFTGAQLRGSLTVFGPVAVFARTHPGQAIGATISEADVSDWCCEFANQLLGRFKNKLLRRGVDIELSTPQGIAAESLRLNAHRGGTLLVATYEVAPLEVTSLLDVTCDETLALADCVDVGGAAGEGDVMLL